MDLNFLISLWYKFWMEKHSEFLVYDVHWLMEHGAHLAWFVVLWVGPITSPLWYHADVKMVWLEQWEWSMSCSKPRGGRGCGVRIVQELECQQMENHRELHNPVCETVLMVDDRALSFLWLMCLSYLYWGRAFPVLKLYGDASEFRLLWCCDLPQKLFWWLVLIVLKWIAFCCQAQNHIFSSSDGWEPLG